VSPEIEDKVFRTSFNVYFVSKIERVKTNFKLTLHETLIQSLMSYSWECEADTWQLKLLQLQHKAFRTIGSFSSRTPIGEFRMSFKQLYMCGHVTENTSSNHSSREIMRM
jgi:hypothetical protein